AVREALGFSAARPAAPSLLGSLLGDSQTPQSHAAESQAPIAFNSQEDIGSVLSQGFMSEAASAHSAEAEEDFSLLDLSDEELESLIVKDTFANEEGENLQPTGEIAFSPSDEITLPEIAGESSLEDQVLSFDDFHDASEKPVPADRGPDFGGESLRLEDGPVLSLEFEHAPPPPAADGDFVIDLSESELETLLKRLEGAPNEDA
ncbi:MAG: hypothetical protein ACP5SH_26315, partial [Syntrophobacteraceae bacterium]